MEKVSTRKRRIVMAAQKYRHEPLSALNHHLDLNWMYEAYRRVRKDAAPGVDGQTVRQYGEELSKKPAGAAGTSKRWQL
jgi:RNA-directed DNA polymerase